jgi:hypothetical protein
VERELLRRYCHEIHGEDSSVLLHFLCSSVDLSHPAYLEMQVALPKSQSTATVRVPHALVLLVDGGTQKAGIGFLNQQPLLGR